MTEPIACGTHIMQEQYRVTAGKAICEAHGIRVGDPVEVWIKPYVKESIEKTRDQCGDSRHQRA